MANKNSPLIEMPKISSCILESDIDTMEISLRRRMEDLISRGEIDEADKVSDTLSNLDNMNVCEEE